MASPEFFDSHMHLNHPDFAGQEEEIWQRAQSAGVTHAIVIGFNLESSHRAITLAEQLPGLYVAVGVSPHDVAETPEEYLTELEEMASHPKVAAIGETGLEYHYPVGPREMQIEHFLKQAELARRVSKTLVIHLRDADDDFLDILEKTPPASAILHCFTASERVMNKAVELGYHVSFSGILTFKKAQDLQTLAAKVPSEQVLIETDAPYLAPVPFRGKVCEPAMVVETAKKIAEVRGVSVEEIASLTRQNAGRAFALSEALV